MRAGAAARVRKTRPRPRRSRVSKTNDPVWRAAAAAQVRPNLCYESDNRAQPPARGWEDRVRMENELETFEDYQSWEVAQTPRIHGVQV